MNTNTVQASSNLTQNMYAAEEYTDALVSKAPAWASLLLTSFLVTSFCLGIAGNSVVLLANRKISQPTVTDWTIFYLAISDLLSLLICAPSFVMENHLLWNMYMPSVICKIHYIVLMVSFCFASTLTGLTAFVRERKTTKGKDLFTTKQVSYLYITILLVCVLLSLFAIVNRKNDRWGYGVVDKESQTIKYLNAGYIFIAFLTSTVVIVCYTRIVLFFRRHMKHMDLSTSFTRSNRRLMRTNKLMGLVALVFVLSYTLPTLMQLFIILIKTDSIAWNTSVFLLSRLYFINNFANPYLYFALSPSFRIRVIHLFPCLSKKHEEQSEESTWIP